MERERRQRLAERCCCQFGAAGSGQWAAASVSWDGVAATGPRRRPSVGTEWLPLARGGDRQLGRSGRLLGGRDRQLGRLVTSRCGTVG